MYKVGDQFRGRVSKLSASAASEGTSGQGDTGTRGEAKTIGRDAIAPLPINLGDMWAR